MPVESVSFAFDGTEAVATITDAQVAETYDFFAGGDSASDTAVSTTLVLTVPDIMIADGDLALLEVINDGDPDAQRLGATVVRSGTAGEHTSQAAWTFDGIDTVQVQFVGETGPEYQLITNDKINGLQIEPVTVIGDGSVQTLSTTLPSTPDGDYWIGYLNADVTFTITESTRLFLGTDASEGFLGNPLTSPVGSLTARGVCIAFDDDTLEPNPIWTRLDDPDGYRLVSGWSIQRGKQADLDKTGTGTADIRFVDLNGTLDPTNSTGPFYGKLDPSKQAAIALHNPVTDTWSYLFRGFVDDQDHDLQMFDDERGLDTVTMTFKDALGFFAGLLLNPGQHGDTPALASFADVYYQGTPSNLTGEPDVFVHVDDRIHKLLDDAGWPEPLRNIFSGNVSVQGKVYERHDSLLAALFDAVDAEFPGLAVIFASKDGIVTFHGRFPPFFPDRPDYGINTWYAGGVTQALADPDIVPITGLKFRRSDDDIINAVAAYPQGISDTDAPGNLVDDSDSQDAHGVHGESFTDLQTSFGHDDDGNPVGNIAETRKFADYYVGNYKDPKTRVSVIRFQARDADSLNAAALWALLCGVELGDIVDLETTHAGGGGFDERFLVIGIRYEAEYISDENLENPVFILTLELDVMPLGFFAYNPFGEVDSGVS